MQRPPEPVAPGGSAVAGTLSVPIELVRTGRQPRRWFDPERLAVLTASIRERGILQPLLVREDARGGYLLVAGERRLRAALAVGMAAVPVLVRDGTDAEAFLDALTENVVRADLTLEEEARAYQRLLDVGLSQREIARRTGVNQATISRVLRLWADEALGDAVTTGALGQAEAQELLALPDMARAPLIDVLAARRRAGEPVSRPELRALVERQRLNGAGPPPDSSGSPSLTRPGLVGAPLRPTGASLATASPAAPEQTAVPPGGADERARLRARSRARALRLHVEVEMAALGEALGDPLVREDLVAARRALGLAERDV